MPFRRIARSLLTFALLVSVAPLFAALTAAPASALGCCVCQCPSDNTCVDTDGDSTSCPNCGSCTLNFVNGQTCGTDCAGTNATPTPSQTPTPTSTPTPTPTNLKITFIKAVGTDTFDCFADLFVISFLRPLVFCYVAENDLAVPITVEDFEDDKLGLIDPGPHVIPPGEQLKVTKPAEVSETTTNTGTVVVEFPDEAPGGGLVHGAPTRRVVLTSNPVTVIIRTPAPAPTLRGVGLSVVALGLFLIGACQLSFRRWRQRRWSD